MRLFSYRDRPVHLGPYPLERLRRTAATSALAARHLALPEVETLLVVGTGRLAAWMARLSLPKGLRTRRRPGRPHAHDCPVILLGFDF